MVVAVFSVFAKGFVVSFSCFTSGRSGYVYGILIL